MKDKTILAMYSGGLDSLYMVYKLLTDSQYQDYNIHVHHIHIQNVENRAEAEAIAVNAAIKELRRLGFSFEYSESSIAFYAYNFEFLMDMDIYSFLGGYICSVNPDIELIAVGANIDDTILMPTLEDLRKRGDAILAEYTNVKKIYPLSNMTKEEEYKGLPETLRDKFWSCRRPVYVENNVHLCGKCKACKQLMKLGIVKNER